MDGLVREAKARHTQQLNADARRVDGIDGGLSIGVNARRYALGRVACQIAGRSNSASPVGALPQTHSLKVFSQGSIMNAPAQWSDDASKNVGSVAVPLQPRELVTSELELVAGGFALPIIFDAITPLKDGAIR